MMYMIQGKSLVKVGSSLALIVPSVLLKRLGLSADTVFDIDEKDDKIIVIPQKRQVNSLTLPKLSHPLTVDGNLKDIAGSVSFSGEEVRADARLAAILDL